MLAAFLAGTGQAFAADRLLGDANGDGVVNMTDVSIVINKYHNIAEPDYPQNADANGDGVINMTDVSIIINLYHYGKVSGQGTANDWEEGNSDEEQEEEEIIVAD